MQKISDLTAASSINATDLLPIVRTPDSATGTLQATVQQLIDLPLVNGGKLLYVDGTNGNNANAARGTRRAFATLQAAKTAAQSGDTIIVLPGTYTDRNLLKTGVNWHFMAGSIVYRTQGDEAGAIFDDSASGSNGAISCTITGDGEFRHNDPTVYNIGYGGPELYVAPGLVFYIENPATRIHCRCHRIYGTGDTVAAIFSIFIVNCAQLVIECHEMLCESDAQIGNVFWFAGEFHLTAKIIRSRRLTSDNGGTYSLWAVEPAGGSSTNWFIKADLIEHETYSVIAFEGNSANYKVWIFALEIRSVNDGQLQGGVDPVNTAAIECYGGGKLYVDCQKIQSASPASGLRGGPVVNQTGGELWLRAMKATHLSRADQTGNQPLFIKQTGGTSFYTVQQWEHSGNYTGDGVIVSGGTADIRGGTLKVNNGKAIVHNGGVQRLHQMKIHSDATNSANNQPIYAAAAGLTLDGCVLMAPALAYSVDAASAQAVQIHGPTYSNKPLNGGTVTTVAGFFTDDPSIT